MRTPRLSIAAAITALLFMVSCAGFQPEPDEVVARTLTTPAQLAKAQWNSAPEVYLLRLSVVFEKYGAKIPLTCMMELDTGADKIRLVAMTDTGTKLLDLAIEPGGEHFEFVVEKFGRIPALDLMLADGLRHIFLAPLPGGGDWLYRENTFQRLTRREGDERYTFILAGDGRLLEKAARLDTNSWRARYRNYSNMLDGLNTPTMVVYTDNRMHYKIRSKLISIKRVQR